MILMILKAKRVVLVMMGYTPTFLDFLTDGLDVPEEGISQSQDDSLGPGDDRDKA